MMRRFLTPLLVLLPLACTGEPSAGAHREADGRLRLEQRGEHPAGVVDAPARATSCASDSSVVAVVLADDVGVAVAIRSPWPPDSPATFAISSTLRATGTAAVAIRRYQKDSVVSAMVAVRGSLRVTAGPRLNAVIDAVADDSAGGAIPLVGRLTDVPVRPGCRATVR